MAGAPPGNQNAVKGKRWRSALEKALARFESAEPLVQRGEALDHIAFKVVSAAISGDQDAIAEIANRLDGKPAQAIIGGDEDDAPIRIQKIERVLVHANAADPDR